MCKRIIANKRGSRETITVSLAGDKESGGGGRLSVLGSLWRKHPKDLLRGWILGRGEERQIKEILACAAAWKVPFPEMEEDRRRKEFMGRNSK